MSQPYATAREHLDERLAWVALLFRRQIFAHWELGILPRVKDEYSGTYVSGREVQTLIDGNQAMSVEARSQLDTWDHQLDEQDKGIRKRLAATRKASKPLPWETLVGAFGLTGTEERALWTLLGVEIDQRLRQLCRYLSNDSARIHCDVGTLQALVYNNDKTKERLLPELGLRSALVRFRLIEPVGGRRAHDDLPLLLRPLRTSLQVIDLAHGRLGLDDELAEAARLHDDRERALPERVDDGKVSSELRGLFKDAMMAAGRPAPARAIALTGAPGSGRRTLVRQVARELGCQVLSVDLRRMGDDRVETTRMGRALARDAALLRACIVLEGIADGERSPARLAALDLALADYRGPLVLVLPREARLPTLARGAVRVNVPSPSEAERSTLWRRALPDAPALDVDALALRYPITGGLIEDASSAAQTLARARGDEVTGRDVHAGLGGVLDTRISALGTRVTQTQRWDDLVLPEDTQEGVRELLARVKHRRRVYDDWGFARKLSRGLGVSALFAGPPGTGKTMVAGLIAADLGLDLYIIDLSKVVSKFVGETEKNLADLFDAAEAGHAVLLFDEADSLFAKRTEVKSSVDRYANLEVNYLLQRMERFDGITILTTNMESSLDAAFKRRLSFRLEFPFPEREEREKLWQTMLPAEAAVDPDKPIDYAVLAGRYEMAGGNIRNAVLRAAFLAAGEDQPIGLSHLRRAADLEYGAMGKVMSSR